MHDPDGTSRVSTAAVPLRRGPLARSPIVSWTLRFGTAAALGVDAAVHWQNAPAYDAVTATISQGDLFRVEAALAVAAGLLVLVRQRTSSWVAALAVAAGALVAVLLCRYVDLGAIGPLPDMYENCGCQIFGSHHAACAYSWISPPSRSRRTILPADATTADSSGSSGGACLNARCGRWPL